VSASGRAERGNTLLNAAAAQLNELSSFVDTVVRPPTVILDARKSTDGNDVVAIGMAATQDDPNAPINYLVVPGENVRFGSLRSPVLPGDIVRFHVKEDESIDETRLEEMRAHGMERLLPVELTVAQVAGEKALIIEENLDPKLAGKLGKLEAFRYSDERLIEISTRLNRYIVNRLPQLGWEPSPDEVALKQVTDRLNQWARQVRPLDGWHLDPLLNSIDTAFKNDKELAPHLTQESIGALEFEPHEGRLLQEAIWLRDISRWASADKTEDVGRAERLFDWTVRNIQLEADDAALPRRPWQVLLHGRGSAEQRAWVFALLCRQQGLDVVVLTPAAASADGSGDERQQSPPPAFSLPAVSIKGQLHVFDPKLGLPIPGPDGKGIATLEQLRTDAALLRRLDLPDSPYPLSSEQLQQVSANIVADTFDLSRAAFQLERKLTRDNRVTLTTSPTAVAERLKATSGIAAVRLWEVPFKVMRDGLNLLHAGRQADALAFEPFAWRPSLWKARMLHFQGRRRSTSDARGPAAGETQDDHRDATILYKSPQVRPSPREVARASTQKRRIDTASQINAAYWLGLLLYDDGNYDVATQWLQRDELLDPASPWASGASYNLGRTLEALGKIDEAKSRYEQDTSPQRHGNRLRAKWLSAEREVPAR
jgi:hypothetical protein